MIYVLSGGEKIRSIIYVTYPAGSICTCSYGGKTLTAKDTSGYALFNVKPGTYTVECHTSDNSQSASKSVSVTAEGRSESVTLSYRLVVFEAGTTDPSVGGWSGNASVENSSLYFYANNGGSAWGYSGNSIDLTGYTKITFTISKLTSQDNSATKVGVGTTSGFSAGTTLPTGGGAWSTTNLTITVDISSVDSGNITLYARSSNSTANVNMNITKIVLE